MLSEDAYTSYIDDDEELEEWPGDPRTPSRRFHRHALTDDEDEDFAEDAPEHEEPSLGFATHTAFDAYFQLASKPARTSSNVFSSILPPLTPEQFTSALATHRAAERKRIPRLWDDERTRTASYQRFHAELGEGFNLLFYGCGSKRAFLNGFAAWLSEEGGHVVVANGFQPSFTFKDLLAAIEQVPGVTGDPGEPSAGGLDAQVQRTHAFFSRPASSMEASAPPHLYIVVHNIDGPAFRASKHRAALALLALAPRVHLAASLDHVVGAPLRWSLSELFARKPAPDPAPATSTSTRASPNPTTAPPAAAGAGLADAAPKRGFAWLWHDLTTLAPYDFELAYADPGVLAGASALRGARAPAAALAAGMGGAGAGAGPGAPVTETAARHVLASVTQKAKKLFVLLGTKQLEVMAASADKEQAKGKGEGTEKAGKEAEAEGAYDYDRLFAAARDNFVAQNDTALRALLGEFRDHGLVVPAPGGGGAGGGEALWIPLRREALLKVVADLKAEGA